MGLRQRGPPVGGRRGGDVALAVAVGHVCVAAGVQAQHGDVERHRGDRVGEPVLRRHLVGARAHQVKRSRAADPLPRAVGEREHPGLGHDPGHRDECPPAHACPARVHGGGSAGSAPRQLSPARCPGRQVPARAVPDRDHLGGVHRQRREQVDPGGDVLERLGPAASGQGPPVLQVPRGVPARRQVRRQRAPERQVIACPPEPPVNDHHRAGRRSFRQPKLTELRGIAAVPVYDRLVLRRHGPRRSLRPRCCP
jgi:hypothetical protein